MKTPLSIQRLRHHFAYSWWKYALLAAIAILGWNIVFTVSAYRPPEDKKVDVYVYGYGDQTALDAYLENVRQTEMSDMEQMRSIFSAPDETYGAMVLMAHMAAGEGDLYILDKQYYQSYAAEGAFMPLDDLPQIPALSETYKTAVERAWRKHPEEGRHLYGLPLTCFPGLTEYISCNPSDYYLSVTTNSGNEENTFKLLDILLRDMTAPAESAQ